MTSAERSISEPHQAADDRRRIGVAWRELRRGASMVGLRAAIYGDGPDALDLGQADALDVLAGCSPARMSALAGALRVDASTATRAVDRLVERGLALRQRAEDDARVHHVALTAAGRRVHAELLQRRRCAMEAILAGFSDAERSSLAALLERLVAGIDDVVRSQDRPRATMPNAGALQ